MSLPIIIRFRVVEFGTCDAPSLVDVVDSQRAQAEDEEHGYEHVIDGSDVTDLKQFTDGEEDTQRQQYEIISLKKHFQVLFMCI